MMILKADTMQAGAVSVDAARVADLVTRGDMSLRDAMARATVTRSWGDIGVDTVAASTPTTSWTSVQTGETAYGLIAVTGVLALVVVFMAFFSTMVGVSA